MLIYCPTQKKKVPSLQVDRDAYEVEIMTRGLEGLNFEERQAARRKAIQERKERMKNPSW